MSHCFAAHAAAAASHRAVAQVTSDSRSRPKMQPVYRLSLRTRAAVSGGPPAADAARALLDVRRAAVPRHRFDALGDGRRVAAALLRERGPHALDVRRAYVRARGREERLPEWPATAPRGDLGGALLAGAAAPEAARGRLLAPGAEAEEQPGFDRRVAAAQGLRERRRHRLPLRVHRR